MTKYKSRAKKKRLIKASRQTRWAPFWTVPKALGKRVMHPAVLTRIKRFWRRSKIKP